MGGGGGTTVVQPPPAPNYSESMRDILKAQVEMAPQVYESELKYQPLYNKLQAEQQGYLGEQALLQAAKLFPQVAQIESQYDALNRAAELNQLQQTLPEYQRAFNALTPGYQQATEAAGQLAQQSMQRSLQTPQLTAFENQVGAPYSAQLPPQQQLQATTGQSIAGTQQAVQGPQLAGGVSIADIAAATDRYEQRRAGQPLLSGPSGQVAQQTQAAAPQAAVGQQAARAQGVPVGGILNTVPQFNAANVNALAGIPQSAGYLNTVGNAQQIAGLAGNVPGMTNMNATQLATQAAASAGQVPEGTGMRAAQTAAGAAQTAGAVPDATRMAAIESAKQAASVAGAVPTARNVLATQSATAAARTAGKVPAAENMASAQSAQTALRAAGSVPTARNLARVSGPQLASNIQNLDQGAVQQYIGAMPGMGDYANMLAQQSQAELAAGRGLTAEEQRLADQSVRAAYAARGTALGPQAVNAEILNRADVANQRYQQRLQNAAQAAGTIQAIYQPALQQSLQRQQLGIDYGLGLQQQAFGQAQARDVLNQQLQAQRFGQLSGTQQAGFAQAQARDAAAQALQAQRYAQAMGTQGAGFEQAATKDTMLAQLQAQRFGQAMGVQGTGFQQAQAQDAVAQALQAQRYAQAMGTQQAGFGQAQAQDVFGREGQAQRFAQAMGAQGAGFQQAQAKDTTAAALQQQQFGQLMGAQGAAFEQAAAREAAAQQVQQQRYNQLMGQQQLFQGAQGQAFEQAMGREQLGAATQQTAFNQALQRGQAEQQRLQTATALQAGQAQLGAGAMSQLQQAQQPVLQAFYNQPILQGQVGQSQMMGLNMGQAAGPQYFNPESQTGMGSIYGAYNSQMNLAGAQAQANAAAKAGKSSMFGSLGGAALGAGALLLCWVAREVYGIENPKWTQFRDWMLNNASDDFVDAYIQHGPKIAEFISDKPELKNMIRSWMDSKIS
jgi:hypothetical protein